MWKKTNGLYPLSNQLIDLVKTTFLPLDPVCCNLSLEKFSHHVAKQLVPLITGICNLATHYHTKFTKYCRTDEFSNVIYI